MVLLQSAVQVRANLGLLSKGCCVVFEHLSSCFLRFPLHCAVNGMCFEVSVFRILVDLVTRFRSVTRKGTLMTALSFCMVASQS